jgi:uncharacterized membrane protein
MPMTLTAVISLPRLPKWLRAVGWRTLAGAALAGGIVHILATLAVPQLATSTAFAKLRQDLPANRMVVLGPSSPGKEALPFLMPDALYAVCRYDLSRDSLRVTAVLLHMGWALSLHTAHGDNFYAMPAHPLHRDEVMLTITPASDKLEFVPQARRISGADSGVAAASPEGLVMIRAPLKGLAWRAETEAALRRASCSPVKR